MMNHCRVVILRTLPPVSGNITGYRLFSSINHNAILKSCIKSTFIGKRIDQHNRLNNNHNNNVYIKKPSTTTTVLCHDGNQLTPCIQGVRYYRMRSGSLVGNILTNLATGAVGVVSFVVLPAIGFSFDLIMSTVGPIGFIIIANILWKMYNYRRFYQVCLVELQKNQGSIQAITRAPFKLPHIRECDFNKITKVVVENGDGTGLGKAGDTYKEKYFKCSMLVPDNSIQYGLSSTVDIIALKSPFFLVDSGEAGGGSIIGNILTSILPFLKKRKRFKKDLVITNIQVYTPDGKIHTVYNLPVSVIDGVVNSSKPTPEQQQQRKHQLEIDPNYYDTKSTKDAEIKNEKKYK